MTPRQTERDILKRLQSGAIELLTIELRDTPLSDTVTRTEVLEDLKHRVEYISKQVDKLTQMNEKEKAK